MVDPTAPSSSLTVQPFAVIEMKQSIAVSESNNAIEAGFHRVYVEIIANCPLPLPSMGIPVREAHFIEGEVFFKFSQHEIHKSSKPFHYVVVLKFQRRRPSLDQIWGFIEN